ncbi:MAG: nucleotide exchange factor GrpE [Chloroflexi bacterium RBG_16_57_11]|nr:MAG: nucleotide exchange factor GrpE [Chloroflexi bacterium RBG_16_57_11]
MAEDEPVEENTGAPVMEAEQLDALAELQSELLATQSRADEYLEGWQRARADFANYKKRVERDQGQTYQNAAASILKRYLSIVDDLERALKTHPLDGDGAAWAEGIELIYRKLLTILESEGIQPMEADGVQFDPNLHEAIMSDDSEQHESGQVIEVLQQGYYLGDRVLRPAMVRVAR